MTSQEASKKKLQEKMDKQRAANAKKISAAEEKWKEVNELNTEMNTVEGLGVIERKPPATQTDTKSFESENTITIQQAKNMEHARAFQQAAENYEKLANSYEQAQKFHTQKNIFEKTSPKNKENNTVIKTIDPIKPGESIQSLPDLQKL